MCASFYVGLKLQEFARELALGRETLWEYPTMDVRPTDPVPGVVREAEKSELRVFRWGLIPSWADDSRVGVRMFNARSETLAEKSAFRDSFERKRCIMPVEAFYEYDERFRYQISLQSGEVMGVAGLWATNRRIGEPIQSCTMVTGEPNELISQIHNRMPAILRRSDFEQWLDPGTIEPDALIDLLRPFPADEMAMVEVGERKTAKRKEPSLFD